MELLTFLDLKVAIRFVHGLAFAIGLGGTTVLDLYFLEAAAAGKVITRQHIAALRFIARIIFVAISLLWITGICFLFHYWFYNPEMLANPKVHAKLVIVTILSLNGIFLHVWILKLVEQSVDGTLFHNASMNARRAAVTAAAISAVSWYFPAILGMAREVNFIVHAQDILMMYAFTLALCVVASNIACEFLFRTTAPLARH